ncbi:MAG: 50S ribosomal protein L18 [Deltaproteobacteria bacterium]|nr:MAG: 50S ribosomal protein L18 [Deltaproteobacteria bacterium]
MSKKFERIQQARARRRRRVRKKIHGSTERPRLTVYRSGKHIYAQVIDDVAGRTLAAASSVSRGFERGEGETKRDCSRKVGQLLAERCKDAGVISVVFDRNGYRYQSGRVHALAEGAREGGLKF